MVNPQGNPRDAALRLGINLQNREPIVGRKLTNNEAGSWPGDGGGQRDEESPTRMWEQDLGPVGSWQLAGLSTTENWSMDFLMLP